MKKSKLFYLLVHEDPLYIIFQQEHFPARTFSRWMKPYPDPDGFYDKNRPDLQRS
jgi:hypothetical protein